MVYTARSYTYTISEFPFFAPLHSNQGVRQLRQTMYLRITSRDSSHQPRSLNCARLGFRFPKHVISHSTRSPPSFSSYHETDQPNSSSTGHLEGFSSHPRYVEASGSHGGCSWHGAGYRQIWRGLGDFVPERPEPLAGCSWSDKLHRRVLEDAILDPRHDDISRHGPVAHEWLTLVSSLRLPSVSISAICSWASPLTIHEAQGALLTQTQFGQLKV